MKPASLSHRIGSPDYYLARHIDHVRRHGGRPQPPPYYLRYGVRYAHRFQQDVRPRLSARGGAWIDAVLVELQRRVEAERDRDPEAFDALECEPGAFHRFAFRAHAEVYLGAGIDGLSLTDRLLVLRALDGRDLVDPRTLREVARVGLGLASSVAERPRMWQNTRRL